MWNQKPPILVCEDDPNDVLFLERTFKKVGITNPVHVARDGEEALDYLKASGEYSDRKRYPFPSVIITDLKMPRRNGFDVLQWLLDHPECRIIPTIVWSSSNIESDVKKAYELGANCYLQKPPKLDEWEPKIRAIFDFWQICQIPRLGMAICAEQNPPSMK